MNDPKQFDFSPLSIQDIDLIEATNLPSNNRHYLRILAYSLATFQSIANGRISGPLPTYEVQAEWFFSHPKIANETSFIANLLQQLSVIGKHLEEISEKIDKTPLELNLKDLIDAIQAI